MSEAIIGVGAPFPDLTLPTIDGGEFRFADRRGSKLVLYMWGSWWRCRDQLPGWQRFYEAPRRDEFGLVTIAVEHAGAAAARRFVAAAAATFPTVVDEHGLLSRTFGFKAIPNGLLVDEGGTIRWAKFGGFSIDNADDVDVVERFLRGEAVGPSPAVDPPYALGPVEREFVAAKLLLGQSLLESGQTSAAAATWREALHLDPQNFTIRKQIWVLEHPDKFHPVIDFDWQGEQLAAEQAREVAAGICGPDGCPMPRRATTATIAPSPVAD